MTATAEPLTRGHKKKARTRQRLVAAALDVIADRGEAFSISEVAERAGVSNGTFYNYFDDREDLLAAIVPEALVAFADESALAVRDDDPAVRFATITSLALARATVDPERWRVLMRLGAAQTAALGGEPLRHLRADLDVGRAAGRFASGDADAVVDVVVGSLLAAARRVVSGGTSARYPAEVVEVLLRGLGLDADEASTIAADAHDRAHALLQR
jgi:AcrR family transcriptional regulator